MLKLMLVGLYAMIYLSQDGAVRGNLHTSRYISRRKDFSTYKVRLESSSTDK